MRILADTSADAATVFVDFPPRGTSTVVVDDNTVVTVDGDRITAVEILDLAAWGEPFDEAAAERVLSWVRDELAPRRIR
jgi:hypothetical protein